MLKGVVKEYRGDDEVDYFALVNYLLRVAAYFDAGRVEGHFSKVTVVVSVLGKAFAYFGFTNIPAYLCGRLL